MINYINDEHDTMACDFCGGPSDLLEAEVGSGLAVCFDCATVEMVNDSAIVF